MITKAIVDQKRFSTLAARAALQGLTCAETTAGNIVLARPDGAWIFDDIEKAMTWLHLVAGEVPA